MMTAIEKAEARAAAAQAAAETARKTADFIAREHGPGTWASHAHAIADELEFTAREAADEAYAERVAAEDAYEDKDE